LDLAICKTSARELYIVLLYKELKAIRERFYFKSFFKLYIVLKKKGELVDKGTSIIPGLKYPKTINA